MPSYWGDLLSVYGSASTLVPDVRFIHELVSVNVFLAQSLVCLVICVYANSRFEFECRDHGTETRK